MNTYPIVGTHAPSKELRTPLASIPCSPVDPFTHNNAPFLESSSSQTLHVEPLCQMSVPFGRTFTALVWWLPVGMPEIKVVSSVMFSRPVWSKRSKSPASLTKICSVVMAISCGLFNPEINVLRFISSSRTKILPSSRSQRSNVSSSYHSRQVGPPRFVATTSIENPSGTSGCINDVYG